jgi:hypothetical protein
MAVLQLIAVMIDGARFADHVRPVRKSAARLLSPRGAAADGALGKACSFFYRFGWRIRP